MKDVTIKNCWVKGMHTASLALLNSHKILWNGEVDDEVLTVTGEQSIVTSPTSDPDKANIFF